MQFVQLQMLDLYILRSSDTWVEEKAEKHKGEFLVEQPVFHMRNMSGF